MISAELVAQKGRDDAAIRGMQSEISSLRGLLETQLSGLVWKDTSRRSPTRAQILRNLARIGIAPDVANIVVDRLEPIDDVRSLWHAPLASLAQIIEVAEAHQINVNIEPHGYFTTKPDMMARMLAFCDSPYLRLNMDTGNFEATSPLLTVQRLTFRDGLATGTPTELGFDVDGGGGAIFYRGGSVTAIDCVFADNSAADIHANPYRNFIRYPDPDRKMAADHRLLRRQPVESGRGRPAGKMEFLLRG